MTFGRRMRVTEAERSEPESSARRANMSSSADAASSDEFCSMEVSAGSKSVSAAELS